VHNFNWMRCLIVCDNGNSFAMTARAWSDSLVAFGIYVQIIQTEEPMSRRSESDRLDAMLVMSKILESRQRIVFAVVPTDIVGSMALAADAMGMVSAGWAWISDALCSRVDVSGNTPQARLSS
jgi:hypothetical protein